MASKLFKIGVPVDGSWSNEFTDWNLKEPLTDETTLKSGNRPHIFFFALLDCGNSFEKTYQKGSLPRVLTEIVLLNKTPDENHFSYEDMGLLSLHYYMLISMMLLFGLIIKQYIAYYYDFDKLLSPHPIMIYSVGT